MKSLQNRYKTVKAAKIDMEIITTCDAYCQTEAPSGPPEVQLDELAPDIMNMTEDDLLCQLTKTFDTILLGRRKIKGKYTKSSEQFPQGYSRRHRGNFKK